jgi:hypothetical protein
MERLSIHGIGFARGISLSLAKRSTVIGGLQKEVVSLCLPLIMGADVSAEALHQLAHHANTEEITIEIALNNNAKAGSLLDPKTFGNTTNIKRTIAFNARGVTKDVYEVFKDSIYKMTISRTEVAGKLRLQAPHTDISTFTSATATGKYAYFLEATGLQPRVPVATVTSVCTRVHETKASNTDSMECAFEDLEPETEAREESPAKQSNSRQAHATKSSSCGSIGAAREGPAAEATEECPSFTNQKVAKYAAVSNTFYKLMQSKGCPGMWLEFDDKTSRVFILHKGPRSKLYARLVEEDDEEEDATSVVEGDESGEEEATMKLNELANKMLLAAISLHSQSPCKVLDAHALDLDVCQLVNGRRKLGYASGCQLVVLHSNDTAGHMHIHTCLKEDTHVNVITMDAFMDAKIM